MRVLSSCASTGRAGQAPELTLRKFIAQENAPTDTDRWRFLADHKLTPRTDRDTKTVISVEDDLAAKREGMAKVEKHLKPNLRTGLIKYHVMRAAFVLGLLSL